LDKKIILLILLVAVTISIGTVYANGLGTNIIFRTSPDGISSNEVMRITSDQRVGINTTSPQATLDVNGNIVSSGNGVFSGNITSPTIDKNTKKTDCNLIKIKLGLALQFNVEQGCILNNANLSLTNLYGANLSGADLNGASLYGTNLINANLSGANLNNAYLVNANFQGADLTGITSVGCTGTPNGTPAQGTLPICLVCGDGLVAGSEACDDANNNNGDGCSSTCQVDPGFECSGTPSVCSLIP
jgi:cysteine-rich repeat protein